MTDSSQQSDRPDDTTASATNSPGRRDRYDRIVWIDCEMTGLDPQRHVIVEIAALVTDGDLRVLGKGVDVVVHATEDELAEMDAVVRSMHASSGLTEEIRRATTTVAEAEQQVLAYLREHIDTPGRAPLAGNSIATDRTFLSAHMPELDGFLHYRMIDVSSLKELARRWFPRVYFGQPEKGLSHRALADIKDSLVELRYYREAILVASPGPTTEEVEAIAQRLIRERREDDAATDREAIGSEA